MSWFRGRRLLAVVGVVAALAAVLVVVVVSSGDDEPPDQPLAAEAGEDARSRSTSDTSSPASTSTSSTTPAGSSSTAPVPTTTTLAPPGPASPGPATSTTSPATSTTAAAPTTTSTTAAHSAADCPDPDPSSDFGGFAAGVVVIENDRGPHQSCMLIADTPERRRRGLMNQDDLDGYAGMAFLFDDERERSFWMMNTRIPLSIAFFDGEGRFVSAKDMEPCDDGSDCPTYSSDGPARFAVEVLQGQLESVGATPGSTFRA